MSKKKVVSVQELGETRKQAELFEKKLAKRREALLEQGMSSGEADLVLAPEKMRLNELKSRVQTIELSRERKGKGAPVSNL